MKRGTKVVYTHATGNQTKGVIVGKYDNLPGWYKVKLMDFHGIWMAGCHQDQLQVQEEQTHALQSL